MAGLHYSLYSMVCNKTYYVSFISGGFVEVVCTR